MLPAAIAVIGVIELLTLDDVTLPTGIGLEVTACALLIWRKNNPLVFCTLAGVAVLLMPIFGTPLDQASGRFRSPLLSAIRWLGGSPGCGGLPASHY